jgi:Mce-associated membrane protein
VDTEVAPVRRTLLPVLLAVLAAVLVALGLFGLVRAHQIRTASAGDNRALVDTSATAQVSAAVRQDIETLFGYRYDSDATDRAARDLLTGDAVQQYAALVGPVRANAAAQKLVVRSTVVDLGVSMLQGDRAGLLVFVDQTATRGDTNASTSGAAQLSVSAVRVEGRWRISVLLPR